MISPLLVTGVIFTLGYVIVKIRHDKLEPADAVYWFFFSLLLIVFALFPDFVAWLSRGVGVVSSTNFILIVVLAFVIYHELAISCSNAKMRKQIAALSQKIALLHRKDKGADNADA